MRGFRINSGPCNGAMISILLTLFILLLGVLGGHQMTLPTWSSSYTVSGVLTLPYAEIKEPFYAYFDAKRARSRIDYYGGVVKTVQLGGKDKDFGKSYKVAPVTTEKVLNENRCFVINGTKDAIVTPQAVLPNTTDYKLVRKDVLYGGIRCALWQNTVTVGKSKNVYSLWVESATGHPVRYEMLGYDSLFGSHYDKYYLEYKDYLSMPIKDKVFDLNLVAPGAHCAGFPGEGLKDQRILMNPMHEYIDDDMAHLEPMFYHFTRHHGRKYHGREERKRKINFMHNLRFIHSHNRAGHSYTVGVNHLADWSDNERRVLRGRRPVKRHNGGLPFNENNYKLEDLPDNKDWRLYGAVTPVKDQAVCGSCWSFATTGTVEGAYFLKTGKLVRLSQQELIDCSWGEGNNGCDGGDDFLAYQWIAKHGLAMEDAYGLGNYMGQDSYCDIANATAKVKTLRGFVNVTSGSAQALKLAIANQGPISVAIDASVRSFAFYTNGVYYEPRCKNTADSLDHAVLVVGYGTMHGWGYWLVKNSWSTYWGNDGYILISQKDNNCGVATNPTFVLL